MKNKNLKWLIGGVLFIFVVTFKASAQENDQWTLQNYLDAALTKNLKIQESHQKWQAARFKVTSVKSLPDPMANYGYFGENVQTRVGPQKQKYGLSQKIPFPGKLRLQGQAQKKQALIFEQQYEAAKSEIIMNVKVLYYDLFWIDQSIEVTEEERNILENLEQVSRRKYESNLTTQKDVIKAQVELTKLTEKLYLLRQKRQSLVFKMNALLNRGPHTKVGKVLQLDVKALEVDVDTLIASAMNSRQELIMSHLSVERAEKESSLAKMSYLPDFTFGVDYIDVGEGSSTHPEDGKDAWIAMVSVNLPIWFNKNRALVREKKAELAAAQSGWRNSENNVINDVEDLYLKVVTYQDILKLYETTLIPQSQQVFDAAMSGYESAEVDFLNWLDAQRNLLQTKLAYYQSISDYLKSLANLQRIVGDANVFEDQIKGGRQ